MLRENLRIAAVLVFLGLLVSCSNGDPITVQPQDHSAQSFMQPTEIISALQQGERAWDVDLASLVAGPNVPDYTPGDIWDIVNSIGQSCNYCAGVFLFTKDGLGGKPYCSWMNTIQSLAEYPHVISGSQHQVATISTCADVFDMPKCDSCLI